MLPRKHIEWLRWPNGFVCPQCAGEGAWRLGDGRLMCAACGCRTSVTAGTIFDRTRTPLTVWFMACWFFASGKNGISALSVKRTLKIGSYQTAWAMLHRLRSVLVRPGRERFSGIGEVDETYIGGIEEGLAGGRARGKKALTVTGVEVREPRGYGRCRMQVVSDASSASLHPFIQDSVDPGTTIITDGWRGYSGVTALGYVHEARSQRAARTRNENANGLLPGSHRVASLATRCVLGTIRVRWMMRICQTTSMSSCSALTAATLAAAACCSTGRLSWRWSTLLSAARISSLQKSPAPSRRSGQEAGDTHPAWISRRPTAPGGRRSAVAPGKGIPQSYLFSFFVTDSG